MTPYEIHLTINSSSDKSLIERFIQFCLNNKIKPLVVDTMVADQVMTASTIILDETNDELIYSKSRELINILRNQGFEVIREKIETWPYHPLAPKTWDELDSNQHLYFESHIPISIKDEIELNNLRKFIGEYSLLHVSSNSIKKNSSGNKIFMVTYREKGIPYPEFYRKLSIFSHNISRKFKVSGKIETEYCLLDSNIGLDNSWISYDKDLIYADQ